jgi:outer membrane receptor protein involved in Fe transport
VDAAFGYSSESGFAKRAFPDASGRLVVKGDQGRADTFTASVTLRAKFSDPLEASISFIGQSTYLHGFPAAYVPLPGYRPLSYTEVRYQDVPEYSKDRWGMGAFVLNYSSGGVSVVSSTSFFSRRIDEQEDDTEGTNFYFETPPPDGPGVSLGDPAFNTISIMHQRQVTHETRLAVEDGTILRGLSGTVGVFYQHTLSNTFLPVIPVPALDAAGLYPDNVGANSATNHGSRTALFSEVYYKLLPKLTLTLGARQYWIDQRTDPQWNYGFIFGPGANIVPATRESESGLVPKAVLSYKVGDEGNIYASASQGFRPGGSNTVLPPVICDGDLANLGLTKDDTLRYKSDTLWSYEVGAKSRLSDGRVNASAAAFQIDWSHIQQTALLPTCTLSLIANAGKARLRGGELELAGRPFAETPLSLQLGLGYTDGVLRDPGVLAQAPNTRLSQVPEWTGTVSASYERPITRRVSLFAAADYSYTGSVEVSNGRRGFYERQPFNMVNGNIGLSFGRSQLMIYGKNLLDKRLNFGDQPSAGFERQIVLPDGTDERLPRAVISRPRQVGLQYQVDF